MFMAGISPSLVSLEGSIYIPTGDERIRATLRLIFNVAVESFSTLKHIKVHDKTNYKDGFVKSITISEKVVKKSLLPFILKNNQITAIDFTLAHLNSTAIFVLLKELPKHVTTIVLTRRYPGEEIGPYRDVVEAAIRLNKNGHCPIVKYRINPDRPEQDFVKYVEKMSKEPSLSDSFIDLEINGQTKKKTLKLVKINFPLWALPEKSSKAPDPSEFERKEEKKE